MAWWKHVAVKIAAGLMLVVAVAAVIALATVRQRDAHLTQQLHAASAAIRGLRAQVTSLQRLSARDRTLPRKLAQPLNVAGILSREDALARRQGLRITSLVFTPGQDPAPTASIAQAFAGVGGPGRLQAYPIHVVVTGSEAGILGFLQSLVAARPLASINQIHFPAVSPLHTTAAIDYEVYVYVP